MADETGEPVAQSQQGIQATVEDTAGESVALSDGWQRVATEPVGGTSDVTQFRADASGDGQLAILLKESPSTATELSLSEKHIEAGESVEVTATVENTGDVDETGQVSLLVFEEVVETQEVTLDPGESETLPFEQRVDSPRNHTVEVAGESEQLEVEGDGAPGSPSDDDESSGYLAIGLGVVVLLGFNFPVATLTGGVSRRSSRAS